MRRDELNRRRQSRLLTDEELRAIWGATGEMAYPWGVAWRLILLTGCRRSEIARARGTEIDHERRAHLARLGARGRFAAWGRRSPDAPPGR